MTLRETLAAPRTFGYHSSKGAQQPAQVRLREGRAELARSLGEGWLIRLSGNSFTPPKWPWLAVLNPEVTRTAQSGLYVAYLYSIDLERIFLSVNQGVTAHLQRAEEAGSRGRRAEAAALEELASETRAIRALLPESLLAGSDPNISLGGASSDFLPRGYEAGNIAAVQYATDALPDEAVLWSDLQRYLTVYEEAVSAKARLTEHDPTTYRTSATAKEPTQSERSHLFRPKDSSDYLAHVPARVEQRSRKHEALVKEYGESLKGTGWKPDTAVHPRDLVLHRGAEHVLCEAKTVHANAEFAVREAIGQLFTYRHLLYKADTRPSALLALFTAPVGSAFVDLLEDLGIASVWKESAKWHGSPSAQSLGLFLTED